jgi:N-acetylmuramoyl-L-alanine amidase
VLVLLTTPLVSQERAARLDPEEVMEEAAAEVELDPDLPPISYVGTLRLGQQEIPLPVMTSFSEPLFALGPIVTSLGGELQIGPLLESHNFFVRGDEIILGSTSIVMLVGGEIVRLPRNPVLTQLGLVVPREALELSYGEILGVSFSWSEDDRTLHVRRKRPRSIGVAIEVVDVRGLSTVVVEFETRPDYVVRRRGRVLVIDIGNDRLDLRGEPTRARRSLVEDIRIKSSSIELALAEGASAAEPYELRRSRFGKDGLRLIFDVSPQELTRVPNPFAPQRRKIRTVRTIVLDPGHGGGESGAIGPAGTEEKDLTLELARALKRKLEARLPVRVVLTRDEDADLPLETRTALANQNKAELFLSIHLNSSMSDSITGAETYFLSLQASDKAAANLAVTENRKSPQPDGQQEPNAEEAESQEDEDALELMLWDLAQSHHLAASQRLANLIQGEVNSALRLRDRGVRQAPFTVLLGATMPAVLLELGFLSNPEEEQRLLNPFYRSDLLDAVVRAVLRYYAQNEDTTGLTVVGRG